MKITNFTRSTASETVRKLQEALKAAGIEGVEITTSPGRFSDSSLSFKVTVALAGKKSEDDSDAAHLLTIAMRTFEMTKKVTTDGKYTLVAYHPRKRMYPFIVKTVRGTLYKKSIVEAKQLFA